MDTDPKAVADSTSSSPSSVSGSSVSGKPTNVAPYKTVSRPPAKFFYHSSAVPSSTASESTRNVPVTPTDYAPAYQQQ